ncbi:MAG: hypothetical protein ACYSWS_03490, partial [Planctomycetota bacterium]
YHGIRKDAAPGFDNMTAKEYASDLEENLDNLYERLRKGRYIAPPVERVCAKDHIIWFNYSQNN